MISLFFLVWWTIGFIPFILILNKDQDVSLGGLLVSVILGFFGLGTLFACLIIYLHDVVNWDKILIKKGKLFGRDRNS